MKKVEIFKLVLQECYQYTLKKIQFVFFIFLIVYLKTNKNYLKNKIEKSTAKVPFPDPQLEKIVTFNI